MHAQVHALGLVHNDLNSANVIITEDDRPVLIGCDSSCGPGTALDQAKRTYGWFDPDVRVPHESNDLDALAEIRVWLTDSLPGCFQFMDCINDECMGVLSSVDANLVANHRTILCYGRWHCSDADTATTSRRGLNLEMPPIEICMPWGHVGDDVAVCVRAAKLTTIGCLVFHTSSALGLEKHSSI
jgi:hypothetical protein